jgi:hypothetical protein
MKYVYILESQNSEHFYVGLTDDLRARLAKHNAGEVPHLEVPALAAEDVCRVQQRGTGSRIREISEVRFRPGIREETSVMS